MLEDQEASGQNEGGSMTFSIAELVMINIVSILVGMVLWSFIGVWIENHSKQRFDRDHPVAADFVDYLYGHPRLRFWQALAGWSGNHILAYPMDKSIVDLFTTPDLRDTWEWTDIYGDPTKKEED